MTVVGGGLAGTEAAWQAARLGADVTLYEMRPHAATPMHRACGLGELTGGNSFGFSGIDRASGLLAEELRQVGSVAVRAMDENLLDVADMHFVDRVRFSETLTELVEAHPSIEVRHEEVHALPTSGAVVLATGPMTPSPIARAFYDLFGEYYRFYFGGTAPIFDATTIDLERTWLEGRFDGNQPVYRNCGLSESDYTAFCRILEEEGTGLPESVSREDVFHEYMPVEVAHIEGDRELCGTVLNSAGLSDPAAGGQAFATCQLAPEDAEGRAFCPVSMQTGLAATSQQRLLRTIPALSEVECLRWGRLYRAVYIDASVLLAPTFEVRRRNRLFVAGALTGLQGYLSAVMSGWLAGVNAALTSVNGDALQYPHRSLSGALCDALVQPSNGNRGPLTLNFSVLPMPQGEGSKDERKAGRSAEAVAVMARFARQNLPEFVELPGASG